MYLKHISSQTDFKHFNIIFLPSECKKPTYIVYFLCWYP